MSAGALTLPRLAVVYNIGSAGPTQIGPAAEGLCEVVFVVDTDVDIVRTRMAEIAASGNVCDVTGLDLDEQANALKRWQLDAITTFSDSEVLRTAELAQMLGLRFLSPDTARWIRDKTAQRQRLRESGVEDTVSVPVRSAEEVAEAIVLVGLPAVLKPRQGTAGRNTFRLHTQDDVTQAVTGTDLSSGYTVETMLRGEPSVAGPQWGDYVSVESSVIDGVVQHLLVCGKTPLTYPFRETGQFFPATLDAEAQTEVLDLTTRALHALEVTHGSTHTEIKLTADGPRIIEVNGRLGGHLYWMFSDGQTGWDVARATLQTALGLPPDPMPDTSEVTYLLRAQPPVDAVSLVGLPGIDAVRGLPGVRRVDVRGQPGKDVGWRNGTSTQVALVYGTVPDHAALLPVIEAFHAELAASYRYV
ncbi:ATP-grasp domain-containing protein [Streptomyces tibetensis]|uniref:ATP-grasp domain-containing protein n=1 Tax=Streptomyces tibetensis TaxID=2382123 RepID=UPI0033EC353A